MTKYFVDIVDTIDSTNDALTRKLNEGQITSDCILIARSQTNGHGTNGRSFISDGGVGIYFTYLHFYKEDKELSFITQKVAVAVYKFFYEVFNIELAIKWVNDLYYNDKKICGILCRNLIKHKAVIVGVGIDLFKNANIDESIKDIAGYIFKDSTQLLECLKGENLDDKFKNERLNVFNDFANGNIWNPTSMVSGIVDRLIESMGESGLPKLYIEKNIIKDKKINEDCNLECQWT